MDEEKKAERPQVEAIIEELVGLGMRAMALKVVEAVKALRDENETLNSAAVNMFKSREVVIGQNSEMQDALREIRMRAEMIANGGGRDCDRVDAGDIVARCTALLKDGGEE